MIFGHLSNFIVKNRVLPQIWNEIKWLFISHLVTRKDRINSMLTDFQEKYIFPDSHTSRAIKIIFNIFVHLNAKLNKTDSNMTNSRDEKN